MTWTITVDHLQPITLNQRFGHWAQRNRAVQEWRSAVGWAAKEQRIPPLGRVHVTLRLTPPTRRRRDQDNYVATLKCALDGLRDAGVLADDTPEHVLWSAPHLLEPDGSKRWRVNLTIAAMASEVAS